jgi:S1-C subfamily serine protease/predicted esterase
MKFVTSTIFCLASLPLLAQDVYEKNEAAMKAASEIVAPSIVKIETAGGREMATGGGVGRPRPGMVMPGGAGVRKGLGPTTGLVVDADGWVITSAFNFANNPSDVFVTAPGQPRLVAKVIATDTTRMLTLLKVEAKGLAVPKAFGKSEIQIGQWCLALGRTLAPEMTDPPSTSVGIISALNRMRGTVMQCDAKVSPVNYGGPLVAIDGRVLGVLVPASPRGEGEVSGVEWYDSGIGFAVPLEDIFKVLPRMKEGRDLRKGLLGIAPKTQDLYLEEPIIGTVSAESAAEKAGIKAGDKIVKIDGKPLVNFFGVQTILGPKYEGDVIDVVVLRNGKELSFDKLKLTGNVAAFNPGFLGILPMRDDADPGVEVRFVYVDSPAEKAGLKAGDRIMKAMVKVAADEKGPPVPVLRNRNQLLSFINSLPSGVEVVLDVRKAGTDKTEKKTVKLAAVTETLPDVLPMPATKAKANAATPEEKKDDAKEEKKDEKKDDAKDEKKDDDKDAPKKEIETGLLKRKNATLGREYWLYVPKNYKPNVSYGVIVWLHNVGKSSKDAEEMVKIWAGYLEEHNFLMMGPRSTAVEGWLPSETEGVISDLKDVIAAFTVDRARVVTHGEGVGGQMAAYLGFNAREHVRAVAMSGAALGTAPKDNLPGSRLAFFVIAGDKHPDFKLIEAAKPALAEKRFPTLWRPVKDLGKEYMNQKTLSEMCVWLDSLDRI